MLFVSFDDGLVNMATVLCGDLGNSHVQLLCLCSVPGSGLIVTLGSCSGNAMSVFFFFNPYFTYIDADA